MNDQITEKERISVVALAPYRIYPAKMGGQKGIADFYKWLSVFLPVNIISTSDNIFPLDQNVRFFPSLGKNRWRYINPFLILKLNKLFKEIRPTHLILEHPYIGWLALFLSRSRGLQLIVHSHNIEALRFKSVGKWWWRILYAYEKFVHGKADLNFFISDEDRSFAVRSFNLKPEKCVTVTYGCDLQSEPEPPERVIARAFLNKQYGLTPDEKILFFNGTLDYAPNLEALKKILNEINPRLLQHPDFNYRIIICGKNLPASFDELKGFRDQNIIYAGFVDEISIYFKGADIFLNPLCDGGGIKTKLVEAISYGVSAVSTVTGAIGVPDHIASGKLKIVADGDWNLFYIAILNTTGLEKTPSSFFDYFFWGSICAKAAKKITSIKPKE